MVFSTMIPKFFTVGLYVLVFRISAIIHQQFGAMLREHLRFLCGTHKNKQTGNRQTKLKNKTIQTSGGKYYKSDLK